MGNCLKCKKVVVLQDKTHESAREAEDNEQTGYSLTPSRFSESGRQIEGREKKVVRFKLDHETVDKESDVCAKGGVVRFRVVVTQRELNQILNYSKDSKYSSVEYLLGVIKFKTRRVSAVRTSTRGWRLSLQSIPEDP